MIEFELAQEPETLVDVFDITPARTAGLSPDHIKRLLVFLGNQSAELGDLFSVTGQSGKRHQIWTGDLQRVNGIGHQMQAGWIQIQGDAGHHVGSRMSGGTIQVTGNVGDHLGSEMTGGTIHVLGDAGDLAGAAYPGGACGQNGGAILIEGRAGHSIGKLMRRGVLATGGDTGNCCGYLMKAGSIVVGGQAGKNVGLEMVRGTIVLLRPPKVDPDGFAAGGVHAMPVVSLLDRYLQELGFGCVIRQRKFQLMHGDQLHGGRGELLVTLE